MRMNRRAMSEAMARNEERRDREDRAPRLREEYPTLSSLRLEVKEYRSGGSVPLLTYVKHVVVDRAPALFVLPCGDRDCTDGGHDITRQLVSGLQGSSKTITGEHRCTGRRNGDLCDRQLRFSAEAGYER